MGWEGVIACETHHVAVSHVQHVGLGHAESIVCVFSGDWSFTSWLLGKATAASTVVVCKVWVGGVHERAAWSIEWKSNGWHIRWMNCFAWERSAILLVFNHFIVEDVDKWVVVLHAPPHLSDRVAQFGGDHLQYWLVKVFCWFRFLTFKRIEIIWFILLGLVRCWVIFTVIDLVTKYIRLAWNDWRCWYNSLLSSFLVAELL